MEQHQECLKAAVSEYWEIRGRLDSLDTSSSYDMQLIGPELRRDLNAAGYLVACAADDLLAELAVA